jgi:DNA-binding CsgD family transcriptional regulator
MKAAPEQRASRANVAASVERIAERRRHVAELCEQGLSNRAIAVRLGVALVSVQKDRRVLGIAAPTGAPRRLPRPDQRTCRLEGCDATFTPNARDAARGQGDYCSREHSNQARRIHPKVGDRVCALPECGSAFTARDAHAARGWGRYCSADCHNEGQRVYPDPGERVCARPGCERTFRPGGPRVARGFGTYCSRSCGAHDRWHRTRHGIVPTLEGLRSLGTLKGKTLEQWYGRASKEIAAARRRSVGAAAHRDLDRLKVDDEKLDRIIKLAHQGHSQRAIARMVGVSRGSVQHWLAKVKVD